MKTLFRIGLSLSLLVAAASGQEVLEVLSVSPSKRYEVVIAHPSQAAMDRNKKVAPNYANIEHPVILLDVKTKERVVISEGALGQIIEVKWLRSFVSL